MKHSTRLSYLMVLSWETKFGQAKNKIIWPAQIQRKKKSTRSKALQAAWAITLNEDITVYYLVKRHSNRIIPTKSLSNDLALFSSQ
jgi:hypothetical protein